VDRLAGGGLADLGIPVGIGEVPGEVLTSDCLEDSDAASHVSCQATAWEAELF
jgi:hypothetical protein